MSYHDSSLLITALAYTAATVLLGLATIGSRPGARPWAVVAGTIGLVVHVYAQTHHWFQSGVPEISVLNILSLCALVVTAMLLGSLPMRQSLFDAGLIAFPMATIVVLAEWGWSAPGNLLEAAPGPIAPHVLSSVLSFCLLSIAAVYALFVAATDYFLRRHQFNALVRALPPLTVLEQLLFGLILAGFVLLTASLVTGWLFVDDLFAQHLAHKTALSMVAWLVFGVLLLGRWLWGWRGRIAVRLTLAGVALLLLSYFGSKLILEVILDRSWQA